MTHFIKSLCDARNIPIHLWFKSTTSFITRTTSYLASDIISLVNPNWLSIRSLYFLEILWNILACFSRFLSKFLFILFYHPVLAIIKISETTKIDLFMWENPPKFNNNVFVMRKIDNYVLACKRLMKSVKNVSTYV